METQTLGTHKGTYDAVFQHPIARNLQWREVRSMLTALSDNVQEEPSGNVKFTRNGQSVTIHPPRRKDFSDIDELMQIRHFLERSDTPVAPPAPAGTHLLVVIDHRQARIYRAELQGSVPQRITPYDPFGFGRDLHYNQDDSNGQRKPELKSFYEAVAKTLRGAQQIYLFGTGTGASSAMEHLMADLTKNHRDIAKNVIGSMAVDEHHLTDAQLLAKARELFVSAG